MEVSGQLHALATLFLGWCLVNSNMPIPKIGAFMIEERMD
jgi:hypothetical protein